MKHKWILQYATESTSDDSRVRHGRRRSQLFMSYMGMQKLKKAALGYMATHLSPAEIENLGEVFKSIDQENEGSMSLKDLDQALTSKNVSSDLLKRLRNLREDLSLTGEERLNWKDFLAAMMDKSLLMKEDKIRTAFDRFRNADDNSLAVSELVSILGGANATKEIINLDSVNSDYISYDEFKRMMKGSFTER